MLAANLASATPVTLLSRAISTLHASVPVRERSQQHQLLRAPQAPPCDSQDFLLWRGERILSVRCLFLGIHSQINRSPSSWDRLTCHCTAGAEPPLLVLGQPITTIRAVQGPHVTSVLAAEGPCSSTLKNGS